MLKNFLLIGLGGAIGSVLRYSAGFIFTAKNFPLATLIVNIVGSFIMGLVIAYGLKSDHFSNNWKPFVATGICGGFTTFSAFSIENIALLQSGRYTLALTYTVISVVLGIAAAWLGFKLINN